MKYNRLGRAGIKVSELSLGSFITFGKQLDLAQSKYIMQLAFDKGVNFFDNAEVYANGEAEVVMGKILKALPRSKVVVSTKIFFGGDGPNDQGTSRKHLLEGTKNSLRRLDLEYVDLLYCHRFDPETPIEETVRAMDHLVRGGYALYWGTSEWTAEQLQKAIKVAKELHCIPPVVEQPEYNVFRRDRVENELAPLCKKEGLGLTTFSPLAHGVLSGKYDRGIPKDARLDREEWLRPANLSEQIERAKRFSVIANELGCSSAQLAIAYCLKNQDVSSVIIGASSEKQLMENLGAIEVRASLTSDVVEKIRAI
jgi:voltage-dependent potassium channel beta subunit